MKRVFAAGLAGLILMATGCGGGDGGGGAQPAGNVLTAIAPTDGATGVPVTQVISATFSAELDAATLMSGNITLTRNAGAVNVPGAIAYDAATDTLAFTPTLPMQPGTVHAFTIGAAATTKAAGDYAISFTTQEAPILYAFAQDTTTAPADLWSMNPDGSAQKNLTAFGTRAAGSVAFPLFMAWSPDLTRIAFTGQTGDPADHVDLYVMNADGSNRVNLTDGAANYQAMNLKWAPDGSRIFFAFTADRSASDESYNLASIRPDKTGFVNITNLPATSSLQGSYVWEVSPDGAKLYYCAGGFATDDPFDIFSINADGTGKTNLTNMATGTKAIYQRLSPDGTTLYYMGGSSALGLAVSAMNVDGTGGRQVLAPVTGRAVMPTQVSPDGTQLVALSIDQAVPDDLWNVVIVGTDGTGAIPLTAATGATLGMAGKWSLDGSHVAYIYGDTTAGPVDLWVANRDGSNPINLTNYAAGVMALDMFGLYFFDIGPGIWSPDGTQIVSTQTIQTGPQMRVVRNAADGSGVTVLTSTTLPQQAALGGWW